MMGHGENRPCTARVARNAYPQLRPGRPIDAQYGANFARENCWELVPIARGNPKPFCDIRRPGRESGSWGPHTSHRIVLYASFVGRIPVTFVTRRASGPEGATAFSRLPGFDRERGAPSRTTTCGRAWQAEEVLRRSRSCLAPSTWYSASGSGGPRCRGGGERMPCWRPSWPRASTRFRHKPRNAGPIIATSRETKTVAATYA